MMVANTQALVTKLPAWKRLEIKSTCPKGLRSPELGDDYCPRFCPVNVEGSDPLQPGPASMQEKERLALSERHHG